MSCSRILIAMVAGSVAGAAFSAAPGVKPGLWERTVTRQMDGAPVSPAADLSKLPPAERAKALPYIQQWAESGAKLSGVDVVRVTTCVALKLRP